MSLEVTYEHKRHSSRPENVESNGIVQGSVDLLYDLLKLAHFLRSFMSGMPRIEQRRDIIPCRNAKSEQVWRTAK